MIPPTRLQHDLAHVQLSNWSSDHMDLKVDVRTSSDYWPEGVRKGKCPDGSGSDGDRCLCLLSEPKRIPGALPLTVCLDL